MLSSISKEAIRIKAKESGISLIGRMTEATEKIDRLRGSACVRNEMYEQHFGNVIEMNLVRMEMTLMSISSHCMVTGYIV